MLRRNNSNRLSRRKSTSSVHSKNETINPDVARQHAQTAANLAFARAQERNSMGAGRGGTDSSNTKAQTQQDTVTNELVDATNNSERILRRQHSVRFAGPNAVQRRQSIGPRAAHSQIAPAKNADVLRPFAMTTNAPVPAVYRPPSRSSSIGKASLSRATVDTFITANMAYNEYYTHEDDVASTPSSYRRIRRSKSMFSPLKAPSIFYSNGSPSRQNHTLAHQHSFTNLPTPQSLPLRAPKSMSFLNGRKERTGTNLREQNDVAVQMARDRFFQQTTQQRLREQPSFLFRSKAQRQDKPFRKSVRSSSGNSNVIPAPSNENEPLKESSLRGAARKASETIRRKLKRVFGRSREAPVQIPNQQVSALATHVRGYNGDLSNTHEVFSNIPHPGESLSGVVGRAPSLHAITSNQQLKSHEGSVKSFQTDGSDDKSRVTSWTSTGVNTLMSQNTRAPTEREQQQRLSIINEVGTHVSSSSFVRPTVRNQFSAYPSIHRASKSDPTSTVDSLRVYSALMKRLDESSPNARLEASRNASVESFATCKQIGITNDADYQRNSNKGITIRHVLGNSSGSSDSGEGSFTSRAQAQVAGEDCTTMPEIDHSDDVFSPSLGLKHQKENVQVRQSDHSKILKPPLQSKIRTTYNTAPEHLGLTPQELALQNEPVVQGKRLLKEARSTFFGGSASFTVSRTPSPFRRALAEAESTNPSLVQPHIPLRVSALHNPLHLVSDGRSNIGENIVQDPEVAYSESEYSRTTSGQIPGEGQSKISCSDHENYRGTPGIQRADPGNGDVIIIGRTIYQPVTTANTHRATTSAGSNEWKRWMSSEVAKLEKAKEYPQPLLEHINYALPTMPRSFDAGHVRESAQINPDDTEVVESKGPQLKQPLGVIQQKSNFQRIPPLKPILKNRYAMSPVENAGISGSCKTLNEPPPPPPLPPPGLVRSPLRSIQSKSSLKSVATVSSTPTAQVYNCDTKSTSLNGRNTLHKRNVSSTTLRSTKSQETPAKLVKRTRKPSVYTVNSVSPGGRSLVPKDGQIASTSTGSGLDTRENVRGQEENEDIYNINGTGLHEPHMGFGEDNAQAVGSRRMVDLFLSSRRRRIASESEENGTIQMFL